MTTVQQNLLFTLTFRQKPAQSGDWNLFRRDKSIQSNILHARNHLKTGMPANDQHAAFRTS